jgi:hypothetical protein
MEPKIGEYYIDKKWDSIIIVSCVDIVKKQIFFKYKSQSHKTYDILLSFDKLEKNYNKLNGYGTPLWKVLNEK